jgi:bzd-type benzoyl-CoA reductase N subunit
MKAERLTAKGMAAVNDLYEHRDLRVRELKNEGRKIAGYMCLHIPVELITAAEMVPYRITGNTKVPESAADSHIERMTCSFIRNIVELVLQEKLNFLDGLLMPHSCDNVERNFVLIKYLLKPAFSYYLNVPHVVRPNTSYKFFRAELEGLVGCIEEFSRVKITDDRLKQAIGLVNEQRRLLREINSLRKMDPPLLTGTEMTKIVLAAMSLPVDEANQLLKEVLSELKERRQSPESAVRVLVWGSEIDETPFIEMLEDSGVNVVIDDLCIGTRYYRSDVATSGDPLDNITAYYLDSILCPRTFREGKPEKRLRYILDYAKQFGVRGAVLYIIKYCDMHGYDLPGLTDFLLKEGIKVLALEDDYLSTAKQTFKTRVEAFVETLT